MQRRHREAGEPEAEQVPVRSLPAHRLLGQPGHGTSVTAPVTAAPRPCGPGTPQSAANNRYSDVLGADVTPATSLGASRELSFTACISNTPPATSLASSTLVSSTCIARVDRCGTLAFVPAHTAECSLVDPKGRRLGGLAGSPRTERRTRAAGAAQAET